MAGRLLTSTQAFSTSVIGGPREDLVFSFACFALVKAHQLGVISSLFQIASPVPSLTVGSQIQALQCGLFFTFEIGEVLWCELLSPKSYVQLEPVNITLFGKTVFIGIIKLRTLR